MGAFVDCRLEEDFSFADSVNYCFSYSIDRDGIGEFFEVVKVGFVAGHVVGAA